MPRFARDEADEQRGSEVRDEQHVDDRRIADRIPLHDRIENEKLAEHDAGESQTEQYSRPPNVKRTRGKPIGPRAPPANRKPQDRVKRKLEERKGLSRDIAFDIEAYLKRDEE